MFKRAAEPRKSSPEADELRELIAAARTEGQSLLAIVDRLADRSASIKAVAANIGKIETAAADADGKMAGLVERIARVEAVAKSVEGLDSLVSVLTAQVKEASDTANRLIAPDGELQKQRETAQQLSANTLQARSMIDGLKTDHELFEKLRGDLQNTIDELRKSRDEHGAMTADLKSVRTAVADLSAEQTQIRETARVSKDDAAAAAAKVYEVDQKLASLGRLQDLARTLDEKVAGLNNTVEHVMQRAKVLELQKHTVERAIVESHRLTGMVTSMEGQITRLDEGRRQTAAVEDVLERIEQMVRDSGQQLDEAGRRRDMLTADLSRLERERTVLVDFVTNYEERLGTERREMQASQARAAALESSIQAIEQAQAGVFARDKDLSAMTQRVESLEAQLAATVDKAEDAGRKIEIVEVLKQDLLRVDEMARRATWQMESLKAARTDLEELRGEVQAFYREHAEAAQLRDRLSADRAALEGFLDRASAFAVTLPELDTRLNAVRAKLATVDEGSQKAANLVAIADDLDRQMTRLTGYQQFVERIESRLNALQGLTVDVDRKIEEQISRRGEIETLRSLCDGVSVQVTEIRQKLGGVTQVQAKLIPVAEQVTSLRQEVEKTEARLQSTLRDEAELAQQERRIADMARSAKELTASAEGRVGQLQGLSDALGRSEKIKDGLMQELSVVQGRQRDVAGQLEAADSQAKQLDAHIRQLEERRQQITFAEKRMLAFESSVGSLKVAADEVDTRLRDLAKRQEIVDAVRKEMEGVRQLSSQSKADLDHLQAHRADVLNLRTQVDELLATTRTTEERLAEIQARRRVVEEVQLKVNVITSMLDDVRLSLETVGTQRAVIDHALADLAKLDSLVQSAERTLKSLQNERQLAEHIERSIQTLRARTSVGDDKQKRA
jgi:chromosome segregation ATPase